MSVSNTLAERGKHYEGPGGYTETATTAQVIKGVLRSAAGWPGLSFAMRESLDMIANKLARIVNGNPFHADSWHDVAGYATLVEKELGKQISVPAIPPIAEYARTLAESYSYDREIADTRPGPRVKCQHCGDTHHVDQLVCDGPTHFQASKR